MSKLRREKERDLAKQCEKLLWKVADAMPAKIKDATLSQLSTCFDVLFDKQRLLQGQATSINENRIERHKWAESKLQEMMKKWGLTREQALAEAREHAPTIAALIDETLPAAGLVTNSSFQTLVSKFVIMRYLELPYVAHLQATTAVPRTCFEDLIPFCVANSTPAPLISSKR